MINSQPYGEMSMINSNNTVKHHLTRPNEPSEQYSVFSFW